jgi:hypothetical protein
VPLSAVESIYFTGRITFLSVENIFGVVGYGGSLACFNLFCNATVDYVYKNAISFSPNLPTRALFLRYLVFLTFGTNVQSLSCKASFLILSSSFYFFCLFMAAS